RVLDGERDDGLTLACSRSLTLLSAACCSCSPSPSPALSAAAPWCTKSGGSKGAEMGLRLTGLRLGFSRGHTPSWGSETWQLTAWGTVPPGASSCCFGQ